MMIKLSESDKLLNLTSILKDIERMPYGVEVNHKTIPPSVNQFGLLIDNLINCLYLIEHPNIAEIISKVKSLKNNQFRELLTFNSKSFEKFGVYKEMEKISNLIHMHVGELL